MVREVRTLQVRPRSLLDIPLITLPFIGDVPPRRIVYGLLMSVLAWGLMTTLRVDGLGLYVGLLTAFMTGYLIAREPKAVSWEKQLYYLLTGSYRPKYVDVGRKVRIRSAREEVSKVVLTDVAEPVKIYGTVYDEYTGTPLSTELTLVIDGREVSKTVSDSNGRYLFYTYLKPGVHEVMVKAGNRVIIKRKVSVIITQYHHR